MGKNNKILISDDVELFMEIERNFLQCNDVELLVASDGFKVLTMAREYSPRIIFLGETLSGLSGPECCRVIKNDPALVKTTAVMVVSSDDEELAEMCWAAGCDEILAKPFDHQKLVELIARNIEATVCNRQRFKARIKIFYGPAPQTLLSEYSVDLSPEGLYVKTDFPLQADEILALRISLPGQDDITCNVRVAWVNQKQNPLKPSLPHGVGLQFVDLPEAEMEIIARFLEKDGLEPSW
ncbi:MAG: hypothetical protein C0616_15600 [Desulfuromonas sp.]|nr:MAG: hypothetical protein C0616_15600 [Desulfuromonas sp.]